MFGNLFGGNTSGNDKDNGANVAATADTAKVVAGPQTLDDFTDIVADSKPKADSDKGADIDLTALAGSAGSFQDIADQLDLTSSMPHELQSRLASGDPAAIMEALQHVGRQAYMHAARHSTTLAGKGIEAHKGKVSDQVELSLQSALKHREIAELVPTEAPPAARFMVESTAERLLVKYPGMSPEDAVAHATTFLAQVGQSVVPKPKVAVRSSVVSDWDAFYRKMTTGDA